MKTEVVKKRTPKRKFESSLSSSSSDSSRSMKTKKTNTARKSVVSKVNGFSNCRPIIY